MQSPEPQLVFRHAPEQQKEGLVHHVQLSQDTSKKQQPVVPQLQVHEQPPRVDVQLVLNTESQPCFGWDISKIQIEPVPFYFPRDMLQWENFPFQDLPRVLERISREMRQSSVQASLIHEPLSAKLQTCHENVELYLVFFRENTTNSDDDGTVSMVFNVTREISMPLINAFNVWLMPRKVFMKRRTMLMMMMMIMITKIRIWIRIPLLPQTL